MASSQFENWDPALLEALRNYVITQDQTEPTCEKHHASIPCLYKNKNDQNCYMEQLVMSWRARDDTFPFSTHPLAVALGNEGCNTYRARMVIAYEGFGMDVKSSPALLAAYRVLKESPTAKLPKDVKYCKQCEPSTNTFILQGTNYTGECYRVPVSLAENSISSGDKVLCIGAGGELRWCGEGEFLAVSHVWEHGWQGESEDGICSRVLELLLNAANIHGVDWVWLDVAMISKVKEIKAMSINSMNRVYSSAKVTLVCDKLLLAISGATSREQAMAIFLTDWMTRVWTMQEALLSSNVIFHFRDEHVSGIDLLETLIDEPETPPTHWQLYGAIGSLYNMFRSEAPMIDRVKTMAKERLTTKPVDLVRAIYPLFEAKWPGPNTSLEAGMKHLLSHLGSDAAGRLVSLHGPIMPAPYSWAPLTIAGCSGGLQGAGMRVTPQGLYGEWAYWPVESHSPRNDRRSPTGFAASFVKLTGCRYDIITYKLQGFDDEIGGGTYYRSEDVYPWKGKILLFLRAFNTGQTVMKEADYFHLVALDPNFTGGDRKFHRIGSVMGHVWEKDGKKAGQLVVGEERLRGYMY